MAKDKKQKGNGAAAPYEFKIKVDDRVRFVKNTHTEQFNVERELHGLCGVVANAEIDKDGVPAVCLTFDAVAGKKPGAAWVHPDDCELLISAGNERAVEEPGDHETASVQTAAAPATPKEPFPMGKEQREVPVPLPPDVHLAKAKRLASIVLEERAVEAKLAVAKEAAKNTLAGFAAERSKLEDEVRDGTELQTLECEWIGDPTHMIKRLIRPDTGAVVEDAILTAAECQESLGFDDDSFEAEDLPETVLDGDDLGDAASASAH